MANWKQPEVLAPAGDFERLSAAVQYGADAVYLGGKDFGKMCIRDSLGYSRSFTIYDTDDSLKVIKETMKALNMEEKLFAPKAVLSAIGRAKDALQGPAEMMRQAGTDYRMGSIAKVYEKYQAALKAADAVDFDDIIVLTVRLLEQFPDCLLYTSRNEFAKYNDIISSGPIIMNWDAVVYAHVALFKQDVQLAVMK